MEKAEKKQIKERWWEKEKIKANKRQTETETERGTEKKEREVGKGI